MKQRVTLPRKKWNYKRFWKQVQLYDTHYLKIVCVLKT